MRDVDIRTNAERTGDDDFHTPEEVSKYIRVYATTLPWTRFDEL